MIKVVLTDIDNTLLDFDKCSEQSIKRACELTGVPYSHQLFLTFLKINDGLWSGIEQGTLTKPQLHAVRFHKVFEAADIKGDGDLFEKLYCENLERSHIKIEGAEDILKYLHSKYFVAAASNAAHKQQFYRLKEAGLTDYIDDMFVSTEIGYEKPTAGFFDACMEKLNSVKSNIGKSEVIIIGDSISADIKGGVNYGIKTCWFNRKRLAAPTGLDIDYTVEKLEDIKKIL